MCVILLAIIWRRGHLLKLTCETQWRKLCLATRGMDSGYSAIFAAAVISFDLSVCKRLVLMINQHVNAFFEAADKFQCWIGLREPNLFAEQWFSIPMHAGKDLRCKAKTADNPGFPFAGLVVDPFVRPEAFMNETHWSACKSWREFTCDTFYLAGFSAVEEGPRRGLVKDPMGCYLFADYDLMAIIPAGEKGTKGSVFEESTKVCEDAAALTKAYNYEKYREIAPFLNERFVTPLILHPPEFEFDTDVGARGREQVFWFGPGCRLQMGDSSMPKEIGFRH